MPHLEPLLCHTWSAPWKCACRRRKRVPCPTPYTLTLNPIPNRGACAHAGGAPPLLEFVHKLNSTQVVLAAIFDVLTMQRDRHLKVG